MKVLTRPSAGKQARLSDAGAATRGPEQTDRPGEEHRWRSKSRSGFGYLGSALFSYYYGRWLELAAVAQPSVGLALLNY